NGVRAGPHQVLPGLRRLPADPDRRHRRPGSRPEVRRPDRRGAPKAPRRPGGRAQQDRLERAQAEGHDVRVGADPRCLQEPGLALAAVADTDLTRPREGLDLASLPLTSDAARVLGDPSIHIVIELVGGLEPARSFISRALAAGKHVVTANKALLAHHGVELYEEARRYGVALGFEAAVAGGIPLIRAVKDGLVANRVLSLAGIVNGTCNYILSKMTDEGLDFSLVLKEAQAHGYAEADPTLDVEGMDSAHKLQILVALAFRTF